MHRPCRRDRRLLPRPNSAPRLIGGLALAACVLVVGAAFQTDNVEAALRGITAPRLRAHAAFLADDLLEGRAPGSRGGRIAARYIAAHFQRAGLQPPAAGWHQPVPLIGWRPDPSGTTLELVSGARRLPLRYPSETVLWTVAGAEDSAVSAPLIFVGYGITAPEYDWDDYGSDDLRGKVLLILAGDPPAPPEEPDRFEGFALSPFGRWDRKLQQAALHGAAGAFIIHSDSGAGYPWSVVRTSWSGEQFFPAPGPGAPAPPEALEGWIRPEAARFALAAAGLDLDYLQHIAGLRSFRPVDTGLSVRAHAQGTRRRLETANVIGLLNGSDPRLRAEAVVFTAHFDHLGSGPAENGDSIYNGAYDNASGVAVLLELASAFASLQPAPRRSVVFIATAAEEAGLLGARLYVERPVIAMDRTAAAINIDGANLWGETLDVAAVGAERSTLGAAAASIARDLGMRLTPERAADQGLFFRSDHFPFALAGVPALHIEHGLDFRGRPPGWGASVLARYQAERYHRPGDAMDPTFDFGGAVQQTRFALLLGRTIANSDDRPRYIDGSAFQRVRDPVGRGGDGRR